jgi:hypothetical protein
VLSGGSFPYLVWYVHIVRLPYRYVNGFSPSISNHYRADVWVISSTEHHTNGVLRYSYLPYPPIRKENLALGSGKPIHPMTISRHDTDPDTMHQGVPMSRRIYTSADYETAFHVWNGPAGQSLRRCSALTGYPVSSVHAWCERHKWHERAADAIDGTNQSAAAKADRTVQELITHGQVPAIIALHEIIADPGHKRRDVAALAMLALGGRPLPKAPTFTATKTLGDGTTISVKSSDLQQLTPTELAHYARTGELPASVPDSDDT